jgi:hypothetical protein
MSHLTHQQIVTYQIIGAVLGALWTWFWLWVWWMAIRVLRWTYLDKKQARQTTRLGWTPPPLPT